jgi:hypothetical protein
MKNRLFLLAAVISTLGALSGCGTGTSSTTTLTGNWAGSITTTANSVGYHPATVTTALTQNGTQVTGSANIVSSEASYTSTVAGTFDGTTLHVELSPLDLTKCPYVATLTYANSALTGTGTAYNCSVPATIIINLSMQ